METNLGFKFEPVKFLTSAFRPGGLYIPGFFKTAWNNIFKPSTKSSPSPLPTGTPKTAEVKWDPNRWRGTRPPEVITIAPPKEVAKKLPSLSYEIAPWTAPRANVASSFLNKVWDVLKWPTETFLKYYQTKKSLEYASKLAEAEIQSQKAAQAVAEAQQRIAQIQHLSEQQQAGLSNILSEEALRKYGKYFVPIALGLVVTMLLIAREKK